MNIAFINSTKKWGGVKTWTLEFASLLVEFGHNVQLYSRHKEFTAKAESMLPYVRHIDFGPDLNPFCVAYFRREFKKNKVDVVVVNVGKDISTAGIAAKTLGIPLVQRIGLPGDIARGTKIKLLHKFLNPWFICPCQYIADGFIENLPWVDEQRVKVILNGKKPFEGALNAHTPRQLIATQQVNPDKDHKTLLKALAKVTQPFMLHIVGRGSCEAELKNLAEELKLTDKITWHGFSSNVPRLLEGADIFLLASLSEGLPNTLLEALSTGLVPICRDVGGVKEVWTDELAPWLLPYEADATAFAKTIDEALGLTDNELIAVREKARQACAEKCNISTQAKLLEEWLLHILEGR